MEVAFLTKIFDSVEKVKDQTTQGTDHGSVSRHRTGLFTLLDRTKKMRLDSLNFSILTLYLNGLLPYRCWANDFAPEVLYEQNVVCKSYNELLYMLNYELNVVKSARAL